MNEPYKHYKHIVDDTNGKSSEELKSEILIDWSKIVATGSQPTISFQENIPYAIEFENRDALLEALCQKVFGAKPVFKDEMY